jgi:hypothetical protein
MGVRENLEWFHRNLQLQLEDRELRRSRMEPVLYFDTADAVGSLRGLDEFYHESSESRWIEDFDHDRALVEALMDVGWLGAFHMLPPHRSEFMLRVSRDHEVPIRNGFERRARAFLDALGVNDATLFESGSLATTAGRKRFVEAQAGNAERFFKALHCVNGDWRQRLLRWRKDSRVADGQVPIDYPKILRSDQFEELRSLLDGRRKTTPANNFADAVSIVVLIEEVKRWRNGDEVALPRFYDGKGFFGHICHEANVVDLLQYQSPICAGTSSVFVDASYHRFRAIYNSPAGVSKRSGKGGVVRWETQVLRSIYDEVGTLLSSGQDLDPQTVDAVRVEGQNLTEAIDGLQRFAFLEHVWLPTLGESDVKNVWESLEDLKDDAKRISIVREVSKAVNEAREQLTENVRVYEEIAGTWSMANSAALEIRNRYASDPSRDGLLTLDTGLLRFGFSPDREARIERVLADLAWGTHQAERAAVVQVVEHVKGNDRRTEEPWLLAGVLWAGERFNELERVLRDERIQDWCLLAMRGATALKQGTAGVRIARQMTDRLLGLSRTGRNRAWMDIAIAYLQYRSVVAVGLRPAWRSISGSAKAPGWAAPLAQQAILHADRARQALDSVSARGIYALNQYVYYVVEMGSDQQFDDLGDAVGQLAQAPLNRTVWQFRYEDTLARSFHRMATRARDEQEWKSAIDLARTHADAALKMGHDDVEVRVYADELALAATRGWNGRANRS